MWRVVTEALTDMKMVAGPGGVAPTSSRSEELVAAAGCGMFADPLQTRAASLCYLRGKCLIMM